VRGEVGFVPCPVCHMTDSLEMLIGAVAIPGFIDSNA
jgi:hypothetical protein